MDYDQKIEAILEHESRVIDHDEMSRPRPFLSELARDDHRRALDVKTEELETARVNLLGALGRDIEPAHIQIHDVVAVYDVDKMNQWVGTAHAGTVTHMTDSRISLGNGNMFLPTSERAERRWVLLYRPEPVEAPPKQPGVNIMVGTIVDDAGNMRALTEFVQAYRHGESWYRVDGRLWPVAGSQATALGSDLIASWELVS